MDENKLKKEITTEKISNFIVGNDPQERIVNLEYSYKDDFIKVYYRNENDEKCVSHQPFYPFLWAKRSACESLCGGDRSRIKTLMRKYDIGVKALDVTNVDGNVIEEMHNGYTFMFYALKSMSYSTFLEFFRKAGNPVYSKDNKDESNGPNNVPERKKDDRQYLSVTPQEQYLISTGKRFFKGYDDYDETLRLIFDWETTGLDTKKDRIEQFGIHFNRPVKFKGEYITFNKIFTTKGKTEEEKNASELHNIDNFLKVIYTFRPDIITAHNGEAFDWNIVIGACERLGTSMEEVSKKYFGGRFIYKDPKESILKLGGEIEHYNKTIVPGTIVTDSLHAVRRAQALDSNMLFSNLKYVAKYSKIVKPDRVYVPGDRISEIWNDAEPHYAINESDGDWYIYDSNFTPKTIKIDPLKDLAYFEKCISDDNILKSLSGNTCGKYSDNITAKELYDAYIESVKKKNEEIITKKGKSGDKFTLYTKNVLLDGYKITTGEDIVTRYLLDDLWECDKVEHRYNTSNFLICKMLPVPFQKCCTMGTAGQWKALMLAWSYENNLAIPPFGESKTFTGGLSRLLKVGFVDNVAKFDYNSLYPSIILTWAISDNKDLMQSMLAFLEYVLTQREKYKKLKKKASKQAEAIKVKLQNHEYSTEEEGEALRLEMMKWKENESANDKKQLPLKIFGNSFFGSYGAPNVFNWASIDCAERTTCIGRMCLRLMIYWFSNLGSFITNSQELSSIGMEDNIYIKYKDNGVIEKRSVKEILNESIAQPFSILTENGWCSKGGIEDITQEEKKLLVSLEN